MTKRAKYIEVDGEMIREDVPVFAWCSCAAEDGISLHKVPWQPDEDDGNDTCGLCGSYVFWATSEDISSNQRR